MAGPRFLAPKPVSPSRSPKRFTLSEANRALPLVKRIVADVVKSHELVASLQSAVTSLGKDSSSKEATGIQKKLDAGVEQLQAYVDELREVGVDLKDYQMGLVDFIGRHQGHDVCLCWKLGEEQIGYWHEVESGFAGRQPVSILEEN